MPDKPGTLSQVLKVVADHGGNVLSVSHERVSAASQINSCTLHLELETLDNSHVERLKAALVEAGFPVV